MIKKIFIIFFFLNIFNISFASIKSEIINRELNYIKKGGKLIFPLPKVLTIDKKNFSKHVKKNY